MIPNRLLFVWFGARFPHGNLIALRAARRGFRPEEILILCDDPDGLRPRLEECADWPELRLARADASWFEGLPHAGALAAEVFARHGKPAARANLIRLAALYKRGGVYLDFDALTVGDPSPLLARRGFCGTEPLALPADLFARRNPFAWARAGALLAVRQILSMIPGGWRAFRRIEAWYPPAPNNAVLGAEAGHPFLERCFRLMAELPAAERYKRFRLGTHLLQRAVRDAEAAGALQGFDVLPPPLFYPLGPEISAHWFRPGTARSLDRMLRPETVVVHWYNSVETRLGGKALTAAWVAAHPDTAFAEMVRRHARPG